MGFFRQDYWSGLPFPSPGNLPDPGIQPGSPALQADSLLTEPPGKPLLLLSHFSHVQFFETVARQAPLSMGFSRQECWSGLPFPSPGDLPNPGIELLYLLHWQADSLPLCHPGSPTCTIEQVILSA